MTYLNDVALMLYKAVCQTERSWSHILWYLWWRIV